MKNWINELHTIERWKKYSQAYEECYLHHILKNIESKQRFILELGAWDGYHLSNTRWFIENEGYSALLIDGDNHGNEMVREHFITKENVLELLEKYECYKEFDLFCIDLDGNDLYIIEEVLTKYRPSVIIAEFNPIFQHGESVVMNYNPNHTWNNDNFYGFSFQAGLDMAKKYGYTCIFQNDNLNMYFVQNHVLAKSLDIMPDELHYISTPEYVPTHYHPQSEIIDWINYV
jgi:hypothetical protein